jgi:signal transduction histidine kinase
MANMGQSTREPDLVDELAGAFLRLSQGDFTVRLARNFTRDRADTLAYSVNLMSEQLGLLLAEREKSRRELEEGVARLSENFLALASGNFQIQAARSGNGDPLDTLAYLFNNMAAEVGDAFAEIERQRKLLAVALAQAQEANRLKSEFLANVSHELRTPLNAIINVPEVLAADYQDTAVWHCQKCGGDFESDVDISSATSAESCPDCRLPMQPERRLSCVGNPQEHLHFLQRMQQQGKHLLLLVNDLLDFTRMQAGKTRLQLGQVAVRELIAQVSDAVGHMATSRGVALRMPTVAPTLLLQADSVKLIQILLNLLGNAIKFTPRGGQIEVQVSPGEDQGIPSLIFTVSDTGVGIPAEHLQAIFEGFRQVDGSHTREHGGVGLGLAITKQLVELHHGRIWAESTQGCGSKFTFIIPRQQPAQVQPAG